MKTINLSEVRFARRTFEPGKVQEWHCELCGTKATASLNNYGPTSFAEAVGKRAHNYDLFECPHMEEPWHIKAHEAKELYDKVVKKEFRVIIK